MLFGKAFTMDNMIKNQIDNTNNVMDDSYVKLLDQVGETLNKGRTKL